MVQVFSKYAGISTLWAGMIIMFMPAAYGQADTIVTLDEVRITALRIHVSDVGKHSEPLDSALAHHSNDPHLAAMLAQQTPLYVRTYGNGTLATLGIRGGSASHTQLLWNGIPLRNPMIGLVDLALIPSSFMDQATVHYGGHGAAFGSGAIGGLISFTNTPVRRTNGVDFHLSAGSWDNRLADMKLVFGKSRFRFLTRLFSQYAENNYRYRISEGFPERNQVHHRLHHFGWLQEVLWSPHPMHQVTARVWYQNANRQIPPLSTQTYSQAAQQDENIRASLHWSKNGEKLDWEFKTAWLNEEIDYQDTLILLYTHNSFRTWLAEWNATVDVGQGVSLAGGVYTEYVSATSANYPVKTTRDQHAVFGSVRMHREDWIFRLQAREELTDDDLSPLLIDFAMEWAGIENLSFKASLSRNYRVPTLNDLHWMPGGNPGILPEKGWTMEAGAHYTDTGRKMKFTASATGYARALDQWIMWMPPVKDVSTYWSPINVATVQSRGVELRGKTELETAAWKGSIRLGLDLTWSTFGEDLPDFQIREGDQLFYVPVQNFMTGIQMDLAKWTGYYIHHWFGDSPGINEDVKAADVGSAGISCRFNTENPRWSLYLQVDNIWNVPYRIIERRPMPGRSITGGLRFSFY